MTWAFRLLALLTISVACLAQPGTEPIFGPVVPQRTRRAAYQPPQISYDRRGVPEWDRDPEFPDDVFTFARVLYNPHGGRGRGKWATDWPDSDLNFSFRLQQLTSLKVNPDPVILELSDPRIFDYPFLYIIEPGGLGYPGTGLNFTDEEVANLRRYCENGGFVMVDDFWGEDEWDEFYREYKRVFPDREPEDLPLEHEIFNIVYELDERPQVPAKNDAARHGITYERHDAKEPHYRAVFDDEGRPMMIICHNTDLGDGWEREGEALWYFEMYSEPKSYPLGINILMYAMTH